MKAPSKKGLDGAKTMSRYSGNVKSTGSSIRGEQKTRSSGGKAKSNVNSTTIHRPKKLG